MKSISFEGLTGQVRFTQDGFRGASRYNFINLQKQGNTRRLFWQNVGHSENGHVKLEQIVWPGDVVRTPSGVPRVRLRVVMYESRPLLYVRTLNMSTEDCQQGLKCTLVTKDNKGTYHQSPHTIPIQQGTHLLVAYQLIEGLPCVIGSKFNSKIDFIV